MTATMIDELRRAGLLDEGQSHLTPKGRDWLRILEKTRLSESRVAPSQADEFLYQPDSTEIPSFASMGDDEDFVCSTSGLLR